MRDSSYTRQERNLKTMLRIWMVMFFIVGLLFAIAPDWTIRYIESIGRALFNWKSTQVTLGDEKFWLIPALSLMATLSYVAYKAQSNFPKDLSYTTIIVLSEFVSTAGFLVCFFMFERKFLYLTMAVVNGCILIITSTLYHSALKTRPRI